MHGIMRVNHPEARSSCCTTVDLTELQKRKIVGISPSEYMKAKATRTP